METIFSSFSEMDLSENHIKRLHGQLLAYSIKDERHRGPSKTHPSHVEAFYCEGRSLGFVFETATPFDTPGGMEALVAWTNTALEDGEFHPLIIDGAYMCSSTDSINFGKLSCHYRAGYCAVACANRLRACWLSGSSSIAL